jgi:hypothetical protein
MSVTTYTTLRQQLKRFTRRTDIDDVFDTMVELVENDIYAGKSPLRVMELVATATDDCAIDDRTMPLPDSYLEMIKVEVKNTSTSTEIVEMAALSIDTMPSNVSGGKPYRFCVRDGKVVFDAIPDTNYWIDFTYFKRLPKLTEAAPTNALLTNYPRLYFYGLQAVIYDFAGEIEMAREKNMLFQADIAGANHKYKTGSFGPSLKMAGSSFAGGARWQK